jgi:polar amino acid transport system substrate-binding protein
MRFNKYSRSGRVKRLPLPRRLLVVLIVTACCAACDSIPRDPNDTLKRAQGGTLRVGLVERPPWVIRTTGEPTGAEVELVRRFASELGATPEWYWGGEQQHMEALERFELEMVVGGLTRLPPRPC